jgi:hypothetical protein
MSCDLDHAPWLAPGVSPRPRLLIRRGLLIASSIFTGIMVGLFGAFLGLVAITPTTPPPPPSKPPATTPASPASATEPVTSP